MSSRLTLQAIPSLTLLALVGFAAACNGSEPIDTSDSDSTVVWHPGNRPLLGVGGDEAQGFLRLEAVSGIDDGLSLAPGQQARLSLQAQLMH